MAKVRTQKARIFQVQNIAKDGGAVAVLKEFTAEAGQPSEPVIKEAAAYMESVIKDGQTCQLVQVRRRVVSETVTKKVIKEA